MEVLREVIPNEGDLNATILNPIASIILKWLRFKLLRVAAKLAPVSLGLS
jgi:hypothetical protein